MNSQSNRRHFLKIGTGAAGILALSSPFAKAFAASCGLTPPQTSGPFYPGESQFHKDSDLTQIPGHTSRALGQVVYVRGKVVDSKCKPIVGANV